MKLGDTITLPSLEVELYRSEVGHIRHRLRAGGTVSITGIGSCRISPRKTESTYTLSNGETILVVSRKVPLPPHAIDGVLLSVGSAFTWIHHRGLTDFLGRWNADRKAVRDDIRKSWERTFVLSPLPRTGTPTIGLRTPQLGALYALAAHWSLYSSAATIVMPTGTGKTETMMAGLVGFAEGTSLVVVPSRQLRAQTVEKLLGLGLLRHLGVLNDAARNPIVGVLEHRPKQVEDIAFFQDCDMVVSVVNTVAQGTAADQAAAIVERVSCLVLDEAHHVAARSWSQLRDQFLKTRTLQFTATPFRRDAQPVDGKIIYNYPLHRAQADGYFRKIHFHAVYPLREPRLFSNAAES
jgi:hypothetical protein